MFIWGFTLVNVAGFCVLSRATETASQVGGIDAAIMLKPTAFELRYGRARREDTDLFLQPKRKSTRGTWLWFS